MKNSKIKKITGAVLAITLLCVMSGLFIFKTNSTFKFIADKDVVLKSEEFEGVLASFKPQDGHKWYNDIYSYTTSNEHNFDSNTIGNPIVIPVNLSYDKVVPKLDHYDNDFAKEYFLVKNTGKVPMKILLRSVKEDSNNKNDIEFSKGLRHKLYMYLDGKKLNPIYFHEKNVDSGDITVNPGETLFFHYTINLVDKKDQAGNQGANNHQIGGKYDGKLILEIVPIE